MYLCMTAQRVELCAHFLGAVFPDVGDAERIDREEDVLGAYRLCRGEEGYAVLAASRFRRGIRDALEHAAVIVLYLLLSFG